MTSKQKPSPEVRGCGSPTNRTPEKRIAFLAVLGETGNIAMAIRGAGLSRVGAYMWRRDDPEFSKEWDEALKLGIEGLEDEANRRAFHGVDKPVFHLGRRCGEWVDANGQPVEWDEKRKKWINGKGEPTEATFRPHAIREFSDTLAIFLLKAHKPEKYRERYEHTGPGGGPIQFERIERRIVDAAPQPKLEGSKKAPA